MHLYQKSYKLNFDARIVSYNKTFIVKSKYVYQKCNISYLLIN